MAPYLPPAPFYGTGLHRFFFLLFRQKDVLDLADVESSANWFTPREGFPFPQWKASMGYSSPAAINGFYVEWEEVVDLYHKSSRCFPPEQFMSPKQKSVAEKALALGLHQSSQGPQTPTADDDDDDEDGDDDEDNEHEKEKSEPPPEESKPAEKAVVNQEVPSTVINLHFKILMSVNV